MFYINPTLIHQYIRPSENKKKKKDLKLMREIIIGNIDLTIIGK